MYGRALGAIQGVITIALLALLFRGVDWAAFRALYTRLPFSFYAISLAVVGGGLVLYAWRWSVLLRAAGAAVPFRVVVQQYFIGVFVNNFLPSTVGGDAAKVFYLGRGHGYRVITASVLLDRLLGLGLLAALATAALWIEPVPHPRYAAARVALTLIAGLALAVLMVTMVGSGGVLRRLASIGGRVAPIAGHLQAFRADVARAARSPSVWLASATSMTVYFAALTLVYQQFVALQTGRPVGFGAVLTAIASVSVLSNIPIAFNGLGLREQLHVFMLEPLGVPKEVAIAISVLLFGHGLVASIGGGLLWWRASRTTRPT